MPRIKKEPYVPYSIYSRLKYWWGKVKDPSTKPSKRRYAKVRIKALNKDLSGEVDYHNDKSFGKKVMTDLSKRYDYITAKQIYNKILPKVARKRYGDGTSLKNNISDVLYEEGYISDSDYVKGFWKH